MKSRRMKSALIPIVYGSIVMVFLVGMYFAERITNRDSFSGVEDTEYVDGEITNGGSDDIPVVSTPVKIVRPYLDSSVSIAKTFYDYEGEASQQENSIIFYEDTYIQNSGVDYASSEVFDVISVLDGVVISVEKNDILGTTIEIRHSNDLISVYQSLSEVSVKKDDELMQGQVIAKSGNSNINKELGNHLHFELFYKGKIVNPEEYYNKSVDEL